jgi:hypothetical protein
MGPADVVRDAFLTSRHVATPDKCVTEQTEPALRSEHHRALVSINPSQRFATKHEITLLNTNRLLGRHFINIQEHDNNDDDDDDSNSNMKNKN